MKWYYFIPWIGALLFFVWGKKEDSVKIILYQIGIHIVIFALWYIFLKNNL